MTLTPHRAPSRALLGALCLIVPAASGCGRPSDFELLAEQAADSQEIGQTESALAALSVDDVAEDAAPEAAAEQSATRIKPRLADPSCHQATRTGATVTHTFNACTGRYGLVRVTGTLTVVFSSSAERLAFHATAAGLRVNGAVLDIDTRGTLQRSGTARVLTVTTRGTGTGPRGNQLVRQGDYTAAWDVASECGTLDGTWSLEVGARDRTTRVQGVSKCRGQCPTAGRVTHQGLLGREVTVTFDGGPTARWTSNRGHSGTVELQCAPAGT